MTKIFIADTESTGLGPEARVCEYAHILCKLEANRLVEVERFESLVNPGIPIPEGATKVHGITDAMVKMAPSLRDILPAAFKLAKNEHALVVGHNFTGYDMALLDGVYPKSLEVGCTLKAARVFIDSPKHSLDFLREHLKLEKTGQAHSALADCLDTLQIINHMLAGRSWEILESCMTQRPEKIGFGKHKGTKLEDLPEDYVDWLLNKCDSLSWDMRRALKEIA
jgi:DNA polymerase-3 subunit epsilon